MDKDLLETHSEVEQLCKRIREAANETTMLLAMDDLTIYLTRQRTKLMLLQN